MRADKLSIINFLTEIKSELFSDGILKLGLFGSFARDEATVYSDIDIAIEKESNYLETRTAYEYFEEVQKIKNLIRDKFHRNIDIFDLNSNSNSSMKTEILKEIIYI